MTNAFDRLVIEVDASDLHVVASGFVIHRKAVILGSDFHFSPVQVHDRLVASMVAELKLVGGAAQCQVQNLVSQANTENGNFADQIAHVLDGIRDRRRIARPIG